MFEELKRKLLSGQTTFEKALPEALPNLRGKISDEKLMWLANELQGYQQALDFYQTANHDLPTYRIVQGDIYLWRDGSYEELNHPYARRTEYFLSAPISWIEQFSNLPEDTSTVELPELSTFMAQGGGGIVCVCANAELKRIIARFRNEFIQLLDEAEKAAGAASQGT
ncbi:hypothetical protein GC174_12655 [bacterium]|nr:hypothetical protein [bacterium]